MTRISTAAQQQQLVAAMQQHQARIALLNWQIATGKRAQDYGDLGLDALQQVRMSGVLSRETAYADNAKRAAARLDVQDLRLGQLHDAALTLRDSVLGALGAADAQGLADNLQTAFDILRSTMNVDYEGKPLFGGGMASGEPFAPADIAALVALPDTASAFANGPVSPEIAIGEGQSITLGFGADAIGTALAEAVRQLGALMPLDGPLDAAGIAALEAALPALQNAVAETNDMQAANGVRAARAEEAVARAAERVTSFSVALSNLEDIDPAEAITRLQAEEAALQASYQVLVKLNNLSLLDYI